MKTIYRKVKSSKRRPNDGRDVFGFIGKRMVVCCYDGGGWYTEEDGPRANVEYWLEPISLKLFLHT